MALYKFRGFFIQTNRPAFDELHEPGATVLHQGIYRCRQCGTEIVLALAKHCRLKITTSTSHHKARFGGSSL
jgi:hypothetical protein